MRASIVITVDPDLLSTYVDEIYDDGETGEPKPSPQEFLGQRLRALIEDEIPIALWGWTDRVGMTLTVEEESS